MILCVECGNTAIKFGFFDETGIKKHFLLKTQKDFSSDDVSIKISILSKDLIKEVDGAIISSVVPQLTPILKGAVKTVFNCDVKVLDKNLKTGIPIKIDNPKELGSDFICTAMGAISKYGFPLVVADLGTATKMCVVDKTGSIIGVIITSGMQVSLNSLVKSTSQLYEVDLHAPSKIIGKNSKDSIQSGIVYGQAYMVSEFARRMENELGYSLKRVLTGGYSKIIKNQIECFNFEENLSLEGLYKIYKLNEGK